MATLALKHRQNKSEKQRIVVFVGSPVQASTEELDKLGMQLKKNNVSIDIISFGETDANKEKLTKLYESANANETSHYLEIEPGPVLMADAVRQSPILGGAAPAAGGGDVDFDLAETDPDLAMAIRISMEEERARQQGSAGAPAPAADAPMPAADAAPAADAPAPAAGGATTDEQLLAALDPEVLASLGDDPELREALLESMREQPASKEPEAAPAAAPAPEAAAEEPPTKKVKSDGEEKTAEGEAPSGDMNAMFQDIDFVQDLLGGLPGVDMGDARIQEALRAVGVPTEEGEKEEDKKKDEKKEEK